MTGDVRHLLGGYATGTLTPAEHAALMQAALEDQELFDALADDEALRRYLADPTFRKDLLKATAPRQARTPWIAALAVAAAAAIAGMFWIPRHKETALVQMADTRQPVLAPPAPAPVINVPEQAQPSKSPRRSKAKREEPKPAVPPAAIAALAGRAAVPSPVGRFAPASAAFAPGAVRTEAMAKSVAMPTPTVTARITGVDAAIITIEAGAQAGIKPGDRLDVLHDNSPIGYITITTAEPGFSVGKYTGQKVPEVGDTAVTPKK